MSRDDQLAARSRIKTSLANALAAVRKLDVIVANHLAPDSEARECGSATGASSTTAAQGSRRASPPAP